MSTSGPPDPSSTPPWSPYPVQDWQQLPPPPDSSYVDPQWAPPSLPKPKPRWLPYVIIGLVACLMAGGFFVADRAGERPFSSRAQGYVPDDGHVQYSIRQTGTGAQTPYVTESARLTGVEIFTSVDFNFGTQILGATGFDLETLAGVPFWRTTTTQIGGNPESSQQLVQVYQVDGAVTLLGENGPGVARVFRPGLVELPADVKAGATWSGAGSAGTDVSYRSSFKAEAAERGCLRVRGTITYTPKSGTAADTLVTKDWCAHEGVTRVESETGGQRQTVSTVRGLQSPPTVKTATEPRVWSDPKAWKNQQFTTLSIDPNFGNQIMTGAPSAVPPVLTASGLVVRATSSSDLVVFTNKTPTEWGSLWRMRPGGTVVSLAVFGDVVVVTTSLRQVVGYSDEGVRLWQHDLDEVAFQAATRVDDARLALVDNGGTVRVLDIASGTQRWEQSLRTEVQTAPVADNRAVVIADGAGNLTAFSPDDGSQLWQQRLDVARATIVGDTIVTTAAATMTGVSITDGSARWLEPFSGTVDALQTFDGRVVLATQIATTVLDEDGVTRATFEPTTLLTVTADHLVAWGNQQAYVIDTNLAIVTTLDTPDRNLSTAGNWPVAERFGVLLFAGDWTFQSWSTT